MLPDARTTPTFLRLPVLVLLALLAGYNGWCWKHALSAGPASVARFFATWQMFTLLDPTHSEIYGEALVGATWQPIDLPALFPTTWESGQRYSRSSFWQSTTKMRVFAAATCGRHPDHPSRVRFHSERWRKTLGSVEQPKKKLSKKDLLDWSCDRSVSLPKGAPL